MSVNSVYHKHFSNVIQSLRANQFPCHPFHDKMAHYGSFELFVHNLGLERLLLKSRTYAANCVFSSLVLNVTAGSVQISERVKCHGESFLQYRKVSIGMRHKSLIGNPTEN